MARLGTIRLFGPVCTFVREMRTVAPSYFFFWKQWCGLTSKSGGRELDGQVWDEYPVEPIS